MLLQKNVICLHFHLSPFLMDTKNMHFFMFRIIFFLILCHPNMTTLLDCIWILYVAYYTFDLVVRFIKFADFRGICKMTRYYMNIKLLFLACSNPVYSKIFFTFCGDRNMFHMTMVQYLFTIYIMFLYPWNISTILFFISRITYRIKDNISVEMLIFFLIHEVSYDG